MANGDHGLMDEAQAQMTEATTYEPHPMAEMFPPLPSTEFEALKDDIRQRGLLVPILLFEGKVLDGRNRYRACKEAGVPVRMKELTGTPKQAIEHVWSLNKVRRHLSSGQVAMADAYKQRMLNAYAQVREAAKERQDEGRKKGGRTAGRGRPKESDSSRQQIAASNETPDDRKTSAIRAKEADTNRTYIQLADKLEDERPDLADQVLRGEKTLTQVAKELRKEAQAQVLDEARQQAQEQPDKPWVVTEDQAVVSCDVLITDPPYGILDEEWEPEDLEAFTREWATRWAQCGADLILVFWSQRYLLEGRRWLDSCLTGYQFQQILVWHYPNNKSPQSRQMFKQTWEPILFYRRVGCERPIKVNAETWDGLTDFDCKVAAVPQTNFNGTEAKVHPAQKPVEVMRWLVAATTLPGELVCDPFCGSGTTGIAAVQLGRRFHGIETIKAYRDLAVGRIAEYGAAR